ncbi:ribose-phosphate diphosphokinase [Lasiosphaeria miniovina]|uniref:Ribose-phosphate diphosphokinase n=1 Tax=Lasiosphaeria miniovina TaxID=1954250 RepID=A0AA40EA74_9PEZI|nr:ribose-phosphate diphosphokinase [Lasiosphaeria miniovina]KAK0728028.1 ribose-phosphate diphosphokinase [Lasiosphaeria miniovina]
MVRNIVVLGGNSHPKFVDSVCEFLGVAPSQRVLNKFSSGETRCEIQDSVRGKDVFIIQSFGVGAGQEHVNDYFIELCIMISACKTGSARRVTAVLPMFPYSRQPDLPYTKTGAPRDTFESVPATPAPSIPRTAGLTNNVDLTDAIATKALPKGAQTPPPQSQSHPQQQQQSHHHYTTHDYENPTLVMAVQANSSGYKHWVAQAGSLVADLLTCAGADRILTCDLHEGTYQGFFDIPVDNLYARPLLKRYIQQNLDNHGFRDAVIVSPDAGGAKRATAIADSLGMAFALIHKERRPTKMTDRPKATMMLVGDVANRVCILVDDLADTASTITRAAKLLKREGAVRVVALLTHGVLSGDAIARINASHLDTLVVTNTVAQDHDRRLACPKLEVLDISPFFAEAIRRVHHGESISVLFQYD